MRPVRRLALLAVVVLGVSACGGTSPRPGPEVSGPVVVVGAGAAGLAAAQSLTRAGIPVVVLEARDRLGGRMHTVDVDGATVDLGAAWIHGPEGNPVARLAREAGLTHVPHDYDLAFGRDALVGELSPADIRELEGLGAGFYLDLGALRRELGSDASIEDGVDLFVTRRGLDARQERLARFAVSLGLVELDYAGPADRVSLTYFDEEEELRGGDHILAGGYRGLVDVLAEGLDVHLGEVVTRIEHGADGVTVHATSGAFTGSHVIVTVPLGVLAAGDITFEPPLPAAKREAIARLDMGNLEKVVLRFDEVFWDEADGDAMIWLGDPFGELPVFIDMTEHAGAPTLVALYGGRWARGAQDDFSDELLAVRATTVLEQLLARPVPEPRAVALTRWRSDPFSRGSYSYLPVGSSPEDMDTLAEPVGDRLLFAGEATYFDYFGTVHGALLSGLREAERLGGEAL